MELNIRNVELSDKYLEPALKFEFDIELEKRDPSVIVLDGGLECGNKIISTIDSWTPRTQSGKLTQISSLNAIPDNLKTIDDEEEYSEELSAAVHAPLGSEGVNYIEERRDQSEKGHVHLTLLLEVAAIENKMEFATINEEHPPDLGIKEHRKGERILTIDQSTKSEKDMNFLQSSNLSEYLTVGRTVLEDTKQIYSNDWVTDYAPELGVGERLIVEIPDPSSGLSEELIEAIEELHDARRELQKGEWLNCVNILQNRVFDLVDPKKGAEELWQLQDVGYSHQAQSTFTELGATFQAFAGKFRHRRSKDGERMKGTEPYREDAYFLYTTAAGIVQLLARKQEFKNKDQD